MKQIYTKTGDEGTTSLRGGVRVPKDDPRIEANGQLDMLNSMLGVLSEELRVKSEEFATAVESSAGTGAVANYSLFTLHSSLPTLHSSLFTLHSSLIKDIQQELMTVMSHVATPDGTVNPRPLHCDELTARMEQAIDAMTGQKPTGFVVPTGFAHVVRAQCRTAERRLWTVHRQHPLDASILRMMNRLSDYLFIVPLASPIGGRLEGAVRLEGALHPLMLAGTGSDVGKSVLATALCRIFLQDGYHPAPFKAQNMALNSDATPDGLEIGRAQAVQAEAAGLPCHTDMNPLLLKPQSDHTSQVVLHGKPIGNRDAYDYWRLRPTPDPSREGGERKPLSDSPRGGERRIVAAGSNEDISLAVLPPTGGDREGPDFRAEVCAAYDRLAARYNPIVMEGAGSISELNLRDTDLVNLPMARYADAAVILVADIDRGGVFASVYGSIALQTPEDRARIKGIIINKFRGDLRLFDEGRKMIEELCGVPVLGVIPYAKDIHIEEEDSVSLEQKQRHLAQGKVNIAVVLLRHISNFTDFNALERDPRVNLFYSNNVEDLQRADIIVLPGTKATLDDLLELRRNGCAQAIQRAAREGHTVVGICGGYQMMGQSVQDPDGIEGSIAALPGLGLLPITTTMTPEKTTQQVNFLFEGQPCKGYEIHQGISTTDQAILRIDHCIGTYIHGFLDNAPVIEALLAPFADRATAAAKPFNYAAFKEEQYNRLADHVRHHLDMDKLYEIMKIETLKY